MKVILILLHFLVFISCSKSFEPDDSVPGGVRISGKIVFASDREDDRRRQIFTMNGDGSGQTCLTDGLLDCCYPVFSPDGSKILFTSHTTDEADEIYAIDLDRTHLVNLSAHSGDDNLPAFSPDGAFITFTSTRDGNREVYVMNSNGHDQTRLTFNPAVDHSPQFTSDGSKILYFSWDSDERTYNIYMMNRDGKNVQCLTENSRYFQTQSFVSDRSFNAYDLMPGISPDGSAIVFCSYDNQLKDYSIYMADINGQGQRLITELGYNLAPFFTPEGDRILFRSHRDGDYDLYELNLDGGDIRNLTNDSGHAYFSQFSPDGSKILFNTDREQYYKIWMMDRDGSNQTQLTFGNYNDYHPRFQPIRKNESAR
ncbi:MAG: DUF5050 domain-containing protein [Calditrichaeota bacterium]|nr:MAG: DUF5050 domain-containing protein [Calditrichota bacterium]